MVLRAASTDPKTIAYAGAPRCWAHFRSWKAWSEMELTIDADATYSVCPVPYPLFNQTYESCFGRARSDYCIAEEVARIDELLLETVSP